LTLALFLGVILEYEIFGIWGSLVLGFWIMWGLMILRMYKIDWDYEVRTIALEMAVINKEMDTKQEEEALV